MKPNLDFIKKEIGKLNEVYESKGFKIVSIFGSYARESADIFSDIDLTYRIDHDIFYKDDAFLKLQEIEKIKKRLESIFKRRVDLISIDSANKLIKSEIEKEQIVL